MSDKETAPRIYAASRASVPERPRMWQSLRASGVNIVSSWIDEAMPGETADLGELWVRIAAEIASADCLVLYVEPADFPLKGAFIEVGIALGLGKPVRVVSPGMEFAAPSYRPIGSWIKHPNVGQSKDLKQACRVAVECTAPAPQSSELQIWASRARAARQQWLESYGVPISNEFAQFAEAIGNLINLAERAATPQVTPTERKYEALYAEARESLCSCNHADPSAEPGSSMNYTCEWCEKHPEGADSPPIIKRLFAAEEELERLKAVPSATRKESGREETTVASSADRLTAAIDDYAAKVRGRILMNTESNASAETEARVALLKLWEGTSEQAPPELELEQEADGRWLAEFTRFPGVAAYGPSKEEAIRNAAKVLIESEQASPMPDKCPKCNSADRSGHIAAWAGLEAVYCQDSFHSSASAPKGTK